MPDVAAPAAVAAASPALPSVTETAPWRIAPDAAAPATPQVTTPVTSAPVKTSAVTPPNPPVVAVIAHQAATAAPAVTPAQPPVAAVVPAQPPPARPPAVTSAGIAPQPHEDPRALARAAVEEGLVPVHHAFRDLQRRIEELERRATAAAVSAAAKSPLSPAAPVTVPSVPAPYEPRQPSYPAGSIAPIPVTLASLAPQPRVLDVGAIERDANVSIDGAIDGRRRRLRIALTFVLLLVVVFGGLFAALAYSYAPHTSSLEAPTTRGPSLTV